MNFQDLIPNSNTDNAGLSERLVTGSGYNENDSFTAPTRLGQADPEAQIIVGDVSRGEKQPSQYRDAWAAVLFLLQIGTIGFLGFAWGISSLKYQTTLGGYDTANFMGLFGYCVLCSIIALAISVGALALLTRNSQYLVQGSLLFSVVCDASIVVYSGFQKNWVGFAFSVCFLLVAVGYAVSVWRRIPFAAANLECALTAVRSNGSIVFVALGTTIVVNVVYTGLWLLAWLGVYVRYTAKDCQSEDGTCFSHTHPIVALFFLFSLYWSWEVGKNILHVTVAGVVGTWWFAPDEACTFFSPSITDSLARATSYSLGSICLGSVVTALLQVCNHLAREARRYGRGNEMMLCVFECISAFLERLVAYFNKWAYVYIGLYGYDYLTAGKRVMELFIGRGWTAIINDNLVVRVLGLLSLVVGILTATIALMLGKLHPSWIFAFGSGTIVSFLVPLVIGTSVASILMGVVSSAVDTVVVAFCEAPLEFERNHPGLHQHMISAWVQIYPEEFAQ